MRRYIALILLLPTGLNSAAQGLAMPVTRDFPPSGRVKMWISEERKDWSATSEDTGKMPAMEAYSLDADPQAAPQTSPAPAPNTHSKRKHVIHLVIFGVVLLVGLSVGLALLDK